MVRILIDKIPKLVEMGELGNTPPLTPPTEESADKSSVTPTVVKSKLVLVGDCACGKTTLIKRYISEEFVNVSRSDSTFFL